MNYYNCKNYFAFVFSARCFSLKKKIDLLIMTVKIFEFYSAVRDYDDFKKYWEPVANQQFDSAHEVDNPYDYFEIKTCTRGRNGHTARYSPMEISRPTKYILQRGATVVATFLSSNYRRSPLVQGGLEIQCCIATFVSETLKNKEFIQKYTKSYKIL